MPGIFPQRIVLFNVRPGGMTGSVRMTRWPGGSTDQRSWTRWATEWLYDARKVCKPGVPVCMFIDWRQLPAATDALQWAEWIWCGTAVWNKCNSRPQKGPTSKLSTLSAVLEGYSATGIEVTDAYAALSKERIARELAQSA